MLATAAPTVAGSQLHRVDRRVRSRPARQSAPVPVGRGQLHHDAVRVAEADRSGRDLPQQQPHRQHPRSVLHQGRVV